MKHIIVKKGEKGQSLSSSEKFVPNIHNPRGKCNSLNVAKVRLKKKVELLQNR